MMQMLTTRHRGTRGARERIESERSTKAKQYVFNERRVFAHVILLMFAESRRIQIVSNRSRGPQLYNNDRI